MNSDNTVRLFAEASRGKPVFLIVFPDGDLAEDFIGFGVGIITSDSVFR